MSPLADVVAVFKEHDDAGTGIVDKVTLHYVFKAIEFKDADIECLLSSFSSATKSSSDIQYEEFIKWVFGKDVAPNHERFILVADNLPEVDILLDAVSSDVTALRVKYDIWCLQDLQGAIKELCGPAKQQFMSVALLSHGSPGHFQLLKSCHGISEQDEVLKFCSWLGEYVHPEGRVDLLACEAGAGASGQELVASVSEATRRNVRASTRKHGSGIDIADGFYWGLSPQADRNGPASFGDVPDKPDSEVEEEFEIKQEKPKRRSTHGCAQEHIDAGKLYFEETRLQQWQHAASWEKAAWIAGGIVLTATNPLAGGAVLVSSYWLE